MSVDSGRHYPTISSSCLMNFYKSSFNATQKHLTTSKRFQLTQRKLKIGQANTVSPKRNINMNAIFVSLLLAMAFAAAPTKQTRQQCEQIIQEKAIMIMSTYGRIKRTCTESCSSSCASLLNSLKSDVGCCLESYGESTDQDYINMRLQYCDIPRPELCNHANGVVITFSTIILFCIVTYVMNYI